MRSTAANDRRKPLRVAVLGTGKVGKGLARALRAAGAEVVLRRARAPLPTRPFEVDLLVVGARDGAIEPLARELAARGLVTKRTAVVHCAGSLGPEALAPLAGVARGVAQMHPMISFASSAIAPSLVGGQCEIDGDAAAVRVARRAARLIGLVPRSVPDLDRVLYHAAAAYVANGSAALAAAGSRLLCEAGVERATAARMLGPLLRSVAENVERLGLPGALTGPVRRGDARGVARHLETIRARAPELEALYLACGEAQLPLARELGDAPPAAYDDVASALRQKRRRRTLAAKRASD